MQRWLAEASPFKTFQVEAIPIAGMTVTETPIEPRFRLKLVPLLVTAALGYAVPYIAAYGAFYSSKIFHTPSPRGPLLPWLYMQHGLQLLLALIVIAVLKFRLVPADYGLHWPRGKSYIVPAILWGTFFGVLMTIVDYAPQLLAHTKPDPGFPLTPGNIWGWIFFRGRLCRAYRGDPVSRTVGHLSGGEHAGQATYRPIQYELGRHHRSADLCAIACQQFRYTPLAGSSGSADLRLRIGNSLCLLAGEIQERRRADHRP
jgi:hypothetical protein